MDVVGDEAMMMSLLQMTIRASCAIFRRSDSCSLQA
jgi:hypothetical protein